MATELGKAIQEVIEADQKNSLVLVTEKVADMGVLIGQMIKMGLPEILDNHIPRHWKQRNLSWGWTTVIWLAYISSYGDHRKLSMETYVAFIPNTLSALTSQKIDSKDFADDRLSILLKHLSNPSYWKKIEKELNEKTIKVYDLETEIVRCDATSVTGDYQVVSEGLIQFGHHKDGTIKPQFKIMMAGLDPLGMALATEVVSGETADDGLYVPIIKRVDESLNKVGLLYVGDCKMSALETRAYIAKKRNKYLSPLPLTGKTADFITIWIDEGAKRKRNNELEMVYRRQDDGYDLLIACGYEFEREQICVVDEEEVKWLERVLVIKSLAHAEQQSKGLEKRLNTAIEKIEALTPERGRGKKQITDEDQLLTAIEKVLNKQGIIHEMLDISYEEQVDEQVKFEGKGRGSENRAKKVISRLKFLRAKTLTSKGRHVFRLTKLAKTELL